MYFAEGAPKISVVVTSFNRRELIARTVNSLLIQTWQPLEIVICDDHSTDGAFDVAFDMARNSENVTVLGAAETLGMPENLNRGLRVVKGDLIFIAHDGDWYEETALQTLASLLMRFPEAGLAFSSYREHQLDGRTRIVNEGFPSHMTGQELLQVMTGRSGMDSPVWGTAMISRDVLQSVGLPNRNFGPVADVDLWLRTLEEFDAVYSEEPLMNFPSKNVVRSHFNDGALKRFNSTAAIYASCAIRSSANSKAPLEFTLIFQSIKIGLARVRIYMFAVRAKIWRARL